MVPTNEREEGYTVSGGGELVKIWGSEQESDRTRVFAGFRWWGPPALFPRGRSSPVFMGLR